MTPGACACINEQPIRCPPGHPAPWAMHQHTASPPLVLSQQETVPRVPVSEIFVFTAMHFPHPFPRPFRLYAHHCEEYLLLHDSLQRLLMATNSLIFLVIFQQETTKGRVLISGFKNTW